MLKRIKSWVPDVRSLLLAAAGGVLLVLAFPDFELWYLAWVALVPLLAAVDREKASSRRAFTAGWIFGLVFFFGTCWWLTFAPITYAGFPPLLAYFLLLIVCMIVGIFPGIFAATMARLLRRFGAVAMLAAPFVWVSSEFLRYWLTGNNWNAIGYSQAFGFGFVDLAGIGGVMLVGFACVVLNAALALILSKRHRTDSVTAAVSVLLLFSAVAAAYFLPFVSVLNAPSGGGRLPAALVIAIQPNVPMSGLNEQKWRELRDKQIAAATELILSIRESERTDGPTYVILPESPMNFMYENDREFQQFINDFARRHYVSVLFNSAEPNHADGKFFNSAVLVGPQGGEVAQYDKIYLVPFGEFVPEPLAMVVPAFVGSFSQGQDYDLLPIGKGKAGVMICFESHFGQLGREYVLGGADVLIEMTNDGYLGPTPVLRQHLANAVFRAVETNRPVLRVTNVGITAYIDERGEVRDPAPVYQEDTRVWTFATSDGSQTFYVKYGDWFGWLSSLITLGLLAWSIFSGRRIVTKG